MGFPFPSEIFLFVSIFVLLIRTLTRKFLIFLKLGLSFLLRNPPEQHEHSIEQINNLAVTISLQKIQQVRRHVSTSQHSYNYV